MNEASSYRQILRATTITGAASAINVLLGLVRMKVAAVLLGPAGLGLIGLLQSTLSTATSIASLGLSNSGTRQIAEAAGRGDWVAVARSRRALLIGTFALAIVGSASFWLLRGLLSTWLFGDRDYADDLGWIAIGVALTVGSGSQAAILNGMRRIRELAWVSVFSALFSSAGGIAVLWWLGSAGLLAFVLAAPVANFAIGHWFVSRLPKVPRQSDMQLPDLVRQWQAFAKLGGAFMLAGLAGAASQLMVRSLIQHELGPSALGHFQASWMISMTYIGFILQAMATDYYPRLTGLIGDPKEANRAVNEQTEVALLLSGPILVGMIAFAPWIIRILYSSAFGEASAVLRWQILGDVLKVVSWPIGYLLLAAGAGRAFLLAESMAMFSLAAFTWVGLPFAGLQATGIAFLGMYLLYLPVVFVLARRLTAFSWERAVWRQLSIVGTTAAAVAFLGSWSELAATAFGAACGAALLCQTFVRFSASSRFASAGEERTSRRSGFVRRDR